MNELLGVGEFSLGDKVQPDGYVQDRLKTLRKLQRQNPELAAQVISYAFPHPQKRQWTPDELYERLGMRAPKEAASVEAQIKELADGILALDLGLPDRSEGAVDAALRGLRELKRVREKAAGDVSRRYLKEAAGAFLNEYMPSVGAAFDAFEQTRADRAAREHVLDQQRYPALAMTQPAMVSYMLGQSGGDAPVHHRRHHGA